MSDKIKTSETVCPKSGLMGGSVHRFRRGVSPWHVDAFPDHLKQQAPERGERITGWWCEDYWGNEIGFIPDGTEIDPPNPALSSTAADRSRELLGDSPRNKETP